MWKRTEIERGDAAGPPLANSAVSENSTHGRVRQAQPLWIVGGQVTAQKSGRTCQVPLDTAARHRIQRISTPSFTTGLVLTGRWIRKPVDDPCYMHLSPAETEKTGFGFR